MELFFDQFTRRLMERWPDKAVRAEQVTGAIKTALEPAALIHALAEVFRVSPSETEEVVAGMGLGDLISRMHLMQAGETASVCKPLLTDATGLHPFHSLFRFHAAPDLRETPLPEGMHEALHRLSEQLAEGAAADPFLPLYRTEVTEYLHGFLTGDGQRLRGEIDRLFGGKGPRYLITTGIGANEQFCHYAAAMNHRNPNRSLDWILIHSPGELGKLPADATEENTLFMEFSRSSVTEETLKIHEYTSRRLKRIVFSNGGGLKKLAERDGNLVLSMPDQISGRYGRNKTPILLAPMLAAGMDVEAYWALTEQAIRAFDLSNPDSLPHVMSRFIRAYQMARGTDFLYFGCGDETLGLLADEFIQFWNEGVNKNGNDLLVSRFFGLPRDSHMNLEGVLGNRQTKMGLFLLRSEARQQPKHPLVHAELDAIDPRHAGLRLGDEETALALANYQRFAEVMPSMLLEVVGEPSMAHSAVLGQLFSDVTFVYSRLMGIDPGSNPEVKFVRERSASLLADFAAGLRAGKTTAELFAKGAESAGG